MAKRALILASYHTDHEWTDNLVEGIEDFLNAEFLNNIKLYIEYMDTKKYPADEYLQKLYEVYKYKYNEVEFDVIISSDDNAFNFLRKHQDELFPDTPVVFCGVNYFDDSLLAGQNQFTGVVERFDVKSTLEAALKMHPDTRQVVFISDKTTTGISSWELSQEQITGFINLKFILLDDFYMSELLEMLQGLADDNIVIYLPFYWDKSGKYFPPAETLSMISSICSVPIYSMWNMYLGHGIVGGKLCAGYYHGEKAAEIAVRVLHGENAGGIPVARESPNRYMFDFSQIERWGIKLSDLPEDSIVINRPYPFYEENKVLIWIITTFIILQTLVITVLLINMSKRKHAENTLLKQKDELNQTVTDLERSNTELEQFAYVISHDLQEPLRMVSSYMQLLERRYKGKLDSDADDFIGYAVDGTKRMEMLINDLLTFSRVGTRGKAFKPTNLETVLELVLKNLKLAVEENCAVITHDILPTVTADAPQMLQLIQNLIDNAIKFRSEKPPCILITAEQKEKEWLFSVRDNGIGIKSEYFQRIFVLFQRLHTIQEYSGTGIGLALCKKIVERHGGRIWVESEPGRGAVFYFTIPLIGGKGK
ncbi:MAG: GHKL domain-containing protein [Spirochaetales bacterium]|nr:GHKL domain-containing protein [Spirochaetales bacterium]